MSPDDPGRGGGEDRLHQVEDRLHRLLEMQDLMFSVSREIGPALELDPVLESVLQAMKRLVDFKGGTICLVEDQAVRIAAAHPYVSEDVMEARLPIGQGLAGRVVEHAAPIYSPDLQNDPRVDQELAALGSNASIRSYIGVPLVCLGEVIGLLQVDSSEKDAFDDFDLYVLEGLAAQVAGAIESARRYEAMVRLERLKSDFIERVSHELRTPVTILSGFTSTLLDDSKDRQLDEERRRTLLERINHATARLRYLIEEILTLSSLESGLTAPSPLEMLLVEPLRSVRRGSRDPSRVELDCPQDLVVHSDPLLLEKIVSALVDNAISYGGSGIIRAQRDGEEIEIAVIDDGPGVPEEIRDTMFERFVRGKHTEAGMGLGLPMAKQLAELLRGTLTYTPLDDGSQFTLRLPDRIGQATTSPRGGGPNPRLSAQDDGS